MRETINSNRNYDLICTKANLKMISISPEAEGNSSRILKFEYCAVAGFFRNFTFFLLRKFENAN